MTRGTGLVLLLTSALLGGCSVDSAKGRYILAEKLWTDGKYAASVTEFEKVVTKDPAGRLGLQALFRAAMTQTLYLSQHGEAVRKFRSFVEAAGDTVPAWEAQKQIGEILYSKTEQYDQAIQHYRALLKAKPSSPESSEFQFRIGKSQFFLWQFDEAITTYRDLIKKHPKSPWAEKAAYEIGLTYFTRGERNPAGGGVQGSEAYQDAMEAFERFMKRYPQSALLPDAKFGIASCLEEMDQLDAAYHAFEELRPTYPSPNVIEVKLVRIRERKDQRSR
jgi:TolA-binding protein